MHDFIIKWWVIKLSKTHLCVVSLEISHWNVHCFTLGSLRMDQWLYFAFYGQMISYPCSMKLNNVGKRCPVIYFRMPFHRFELAFIHHIDTQNIDLCHQYVWAMHRGDSNIFLRPKWSRMLWHHQSRRSTGAGTWNDSLIVVRIQNTKPENRCYFAGKIVKRIIL